MLHLIAISIIILFVFLILVFAFQIKQGANFTLRPIPAYDAIKLHLARTIEKGHQLHVGLGTGGVANQTMANTVAGLQLLDYVSARAEATGTRVVVTTSDPAVALLAEESLHQSSPVDYPKVAVAKAGEAHWISTNATAYAAGVMAELGTQKVDSNFLIGHFSDEYLLMGEYANRRRPTITTVAGSSDPNVIPYVYATSPQGLWGEELYAAGAYLSQKPIHIGSLLAQDVLRWGIGLVMLGGVVLKAAGLLA